MSGPDWSGLVSRAEHNLSIAREAAQKPLGAPDPGVPVDFDKLDVIDHYGEESGDFPEDALGDSLLVISQYFAEKSGLPLHCTALMALTAAGATVKSGLVVRSIDDYVCHLNLMALLVFPTGFGKTNLARDYLLPLRASHMVRQEMFDQVDRYDLMADEAQAKLIKSRFERGGNPGMREAYKSALATLERVKRKLACHSGMFANITEEALIRKMPVTRGWGFMVNTEASDMLSIIMGQYSGVTGGETFTKGYSGESHTYDRVGETGQSIHIPRLVLACLWMTHPDQIVRMCQNPRLLEMGFLPRFITCSFTGHVRSFHQRNGHLNPAYLREYHKVISDLECAFLHDRDEPLYVERDPEVEAYWKRERDAVKEEHLLSSTATQAFQIRRVEHGIKMAAIVHLVTQRQHALKIPLDLETATRCQALAKWYVNASMNVYLQTETPHTRNVPLRLVERLLAEPDRRLEWRPLSRSFRLSAGDMNAMLKAYPGAFRLLEVKESRHGNKRKYIEVTGDKEELRRLGLERGDRNRFERE